MNAPRNPAPMWRKLAARLELLRATHYCLIRRRMEGLEESTPEDAARWALQAHRDPVRSLAERLPRQALRALCRALYLPARGGSSEGLAALLVAHLARSDPGLDVAWWPFQRARAFVHRLGLEDRAGWLAYCRGERPELPRSPHVPADPRRAYAGSGWKGMDDWLGLGPCNTSRERSTGAQRPAQRRTRPPAGTKPRKQRRPDAPERPSYRPYAEALAWARAQGLRSSTEWLAMCRGERPGVQRPPDIPVRPDTMYAKEGWVGWGVFLGVSRPRRKRTPKPSSVRSAPAPVEGPWREFSAARSFARRLRLASLYEWRAFCRGSLPEKGQLPADVPPYPERVYATDGWSSYRDWLGIAQYRR